MQDIKGAVNRIFSKDVVNTGRQAEVDIAKAVLILCLAYVHVTIECSTEEAMTTGWPFFWDAIVGGPYGAPMFMFAMGVGLVYGKRVSAFECMKRGVKLFAIGLFLNFCRGVLPSVIGYLITGQSEYFLSDLVYILFKDDIMGFAGLAFFLMGLFKKWNLKPGVIWLISFAMNLVSQFFNGVDFHNLPLNIVMSYVIGVEDAAGQIYSDFPVMTWMVLLTSGYLFAHVLMHVQDKHRFYLMVSPVSMLLSVGYFGVEISKRSGMFGTGENCYYHISTIGALFCILAALGMLGIYDAMAAVLPQFILDWAKTLSKWINSYYCIHWVVIGFVVDLLLYVARGSRILGMGRIMLLATVIVVITLCITNIWERIIKPICKETLHGKNG